MLRVFNQNVCLVFKRIPLVVVITRCKLCFVCPFSFPICPPPFQCSDSASRWTGEDGGGGGGGQQQTFLGRHVVQLGQPPRAGQLRHHLGQLGQRHGWGRGQEHRAARLGGGPATTPGRGGNVHVLRICGGGGGAMGTSAPAPRWEHLLWTTPGTPAALEPPPPPSGTASSPFRGSTLRGCEGRRVEGTSCRACWYGRLELDTVELLPVECLSLAAAAAAPEMGGQGLPHRVPLCESASRLLCYTRANDIHHWSFVLTYMRIANDMQCSWHYMVG